MRSSRASTPDRRQVAAVWQFSWWTLSSVGRGGFTDALPPRFATGHLLTREELCFPWRKAADRSAPPRQQHSPQSSLLCCGNPLRLDWHYAVRWLELRALTLIISLWPRILQGSVTREWRSAQLPSCTRRILARSGVSTQVVWRRQLADWGKRLDNFIVENGG